MFYDLNVDYNPSTSDADLSKTLAFLSECERIGFFNPARLDLGYNVIALNHTISGRLPSDLPKVDKAKRQQSCAIPDPLPFKTPASLTILRRCTLILSESATNNRLGALANNYDILALRPVDEKTFQHACSTADCDLISLDFTQRLGYHFKFKTVSEAVKRSVRFEIAYSQPLLADPAAKRNLISNATGLIRATRGGRGIIISSEATKAVGCRAPWDVVNLAAIWGLAQDRGYEAVSKEARSVVVSAKLKRTSFRGVVDVVYGGEKPAAKEQHEKQGQKDKTKVALLKDNGAKKRKADEVEDTTTDGSEKPISKREQKRRAHKAKMESLGQTTAPAP
ncbi:ribonuclease P protein subunit p30 [Aureobasidium sp. EXF-12298]|nr:ribonuclease P protein subunit p30 [Aureobasidium sp. EXF-12298]